MLKTNLYIPKTIKVGYQNRNDTFTKKLAYVIYTDDKGVLRKEKSWNSWRDLTLGEDSFQNEPTSGFMLNKSVNRYDWSHFSSGRSYIRVHDPRGFEFEISNENLLGILMDTNCNHRVLEGEFIYSWNGTELVLLPCNSEVYQSAQDFTKAQTGSIKSEDLIPGHLYLSKKMEEYVYLGKFRWGSEKKKKYIFLEMKRYNLYLEKDSNPIHKDYMFIDMSSLSRFSKRISDCPVAYYADVMDLLNKDMRSSSVVEHILNESDVNTLNIKTFNMQTPLGFIKENEKYYSVRFRKNIFFNNEVELEFIEVYVCPEIKQFKYVLKLVTGLRLSYNTTVNTYKTLSYEEFSKMKFYDVSYKLENGSITSTTRDLVLKYYQ